MQQSKVGYNLVTMAFEFKLPDVGEGIHEGEIVRWRVALGEEVKEDQPLIEVETAKAIVELPSPKAGFILKMNGKEGETIHVGDVVVVIGAKDEKLEDAKPATTAPQAGSQTSTKTTETSTKEQQGVVGEIPMKIEGFVLPARTAEGVQSANTGVQKIMPRIRKLAQDLGVNLANIKGTGNGGEVTEADVRNSQSQSVQNAENTKVLAAPKLNFEKYGPVERAPLKGMRKAIAEHMVRSMQTIPHVTHCDEFDASHLVTKRAAQKPDAEKSGIKLTYLAYIVQAVIAALKEFPEFNASIDDSTNEVVYKNYMNLGIAVDTPEGLMVPVIKNANQKDLFMIAQEIVELATKARDRKVAPADIEGGTFTITNIGSIGGTEATPIIPYGQSAILGVMKMTDTPVAVEGKVEIRPVMSLCLSYDHRLIDGAQAARFMNAVIQELKQ